MTTHFPPEIPARLRELAARWEDTKATERASLQTYALELCTALGVPVPSPPTEAYQFERDVRVVDRDGTESTNFIDLWKADHFALEGKALFDTTVASRDRRLRKAYGQVRNYAQGIGTPPPFLMVLDVARTLIVWDRWSGRYGDFAAGRRIGLATLHERDDEIALLRDIWTNPAERDPRGKAQIVTKELAARLAGLVSAIESRGHDSQSVARFVMRCVFCFFAEDVGLLPKALFQETLERASGRPEQLAKALTSLWSTMDTGGMYGSQLLQRFNGHFFKSVEALPLGADEVNLLIEAAKSDWSRVEPSIFGTLLVRALDPAERHQLGAEYTPRSFIERLVRPTVEEPIRDRWRAVQAEVLQLEAQAAVPEGKKPTKPQQRILNEAVARLREFHAWMRGLRFLDPACGSGNFLYVTMDIVKHIELEVLREIERIAGGQSVLVMDEVHPRQFHGIEVKEWAREIAELTLWIGYHQWWRETHGGRTPPDPILEDTGTLECRDAVLAWDEIRHDPSRDRPDPTPRIVHPVTGELVPDPHAKLEYLEYLNPRPAEWPKAHFIVGNPPYIGKSRKRKALGDGYVDALIAAYPTIPPAADFVMLWWHRAAGAVLSGFTQAAGLITTKSIVQRQSRVVIEQELERGIGITFAIPNHPWTDEVAAAAVRVAMTVISGSNKQSARLIDVDYEGVVTSDRIVPRLNADLSSGADVAAAAHEPLIAWKGLATVGFKLYGDGFVLSAQEAIDLLNREPAAKDLVRPYVIGRDIAGRGSNGFVIDFGNRSEAEAREYPIAFDTVRDRVKPHRNANSNADIRARWWQFGHLRAQLRTASAELARIIVTPETPEHRFFQFLSTQVAPEGSVFCVAVDSAWLLAVLSSSAHRAWAAAASGRMGIGDQYRYNKACLDPYPLPDLTESQRSELSATGERLDAHRALALGRDERVTMTGMYNVVEKLGTGAPLTSREREIHEIAACGVLKDLHDEIDALVARAYGWVWPTPREEILNRLVILHDERVNEERRGLVRWLRPNYQIPRMAVEAGGAPEEFVLDSPEPEPSEQALPAWPATAIDQLTALNELLAQHAATAIEAAAAFTGASLPLVERHLDTLALMGELRKDPSGCFAMPRRAP